MFEIDWRTVTYRKSRRRAVSIFVLFLNLLTAVSPTWANSDETASAGCYCIGTVGNVNCDYRDEITVGDVALLIDNLYISGVRLPNLQEANINGDPAGEITVGDVAMLLDHLFITGVELPDCPLPYNTPPATQTVGLPLEIPYWGSVPFVNSIEPFSAATGVRFRWEASDIVDHPYGNPEFEYEYRMYGPFSDSLLDIVTDSFIVNVFRHDDGRMFRFNQTPPELFETCDTFWLPGGSQVIFCDTVLIDTLEESNIYGIIDTLFDFEHPDFVGNPDLNQLAVISDDGGDAWITTDHDSLYNLYAYYPSDTTLEMSFLFMVRARETTAPDAVDPTPAFITFMVIDPKHERDILVMNLSGSAHENKALEDSVGAYWDGAIPSWVTSNGLDEIVHFDSERDFLGYIFEYPTNNQILRLALKYKIVVVLQDAAATGYWSLRGSAWENVIVAMQTGVNVWTAARAPLGNYSISSPAFGNYASSTYQYFFGVETYRFPGWGSHLLNYYDGYGYGLPRVEDFIGASSQFPETWPDILIDTSFLHGRYDWQGHIPDSGQSDGFPFYPFLPDPGALPQVGWCEPTEDAEVLYTYVSLYGDDPHPYDTTRHYHGQPVMHRLDRGLFRSVHSVFTPLALEETTGQQMIDSVLNWLYDKWLLDSVSDRPTDIVGALNEGGAR